MHKKLLQNRVRKQARDRFGDFPDLLAIQVANCNNILDLKSFVEFCKRLMLV